MIAAAARDAAALAVEHRVAVLWLLFAGRFRAAAVGTERARFLEQFALDALDAIEAQAPHP